MGRFQLELILTEKSNSYLTLVCRLTRKEQELSANTVTFIGCRRIMLADAARGVVRRSRVRLTDVDTGRLFGFKYKLVCYFKLTEDMVGVESEFFVYDADGHLLAKYCICKHSQS